MISIGVFSIALIIVNTAADVVDSNDGVTSLQEALTLANGTAEADTIVFDAALKGQTIRPGSSETPFLLEIEEGTLTIDGDVDGDGKADITLSGDVEGDGTGDSALLLVHGDANVKVSGIQFSDGISRQSTLFFHQDEQRSVIDNEGVLVIENSIISDLSLIHI